MTIRNIDIDRFSAYLIRILVGIQFFLLILYLLFLYCNPEQEVVVWDSFTYYQDAINSFTTENIFETLDQVKNELHRPAFYWLILLILKIVGLKLNYQLLTFLTTIFYNSVLIYSVYYILNSIGSGKSIILTAISSIYSLPIIVYFSTVFMGDIPTAAWVMLLCAILVAINNQRKLYQKILLLGVISALGFQTKPIFIFCLVIIIFSYLLSNLLKTIITIPNINIVTIVKQFIPKLFIFSTSFYVTSLFIFPNTIFQLIKELSYNNEVLGYWQSYQSIFNSVLWFPSILFAEIPIIHVSILIFICVAYIYFFLNHKKVINLSIRNKIPIFLIQIFDYKLTFIVMSLGCFILYASLFVTTKDARSFLFLFPLLIVVVYSCLYQFTSHLIIKSSITYFLIGFIILSNITNVISWTNSSFHLTGLNVFNNYLNIVDFKFEIRPRFVEINNRETYQKLAIDRVVGFIEQNCTPKCDSEPTSIYMPHGTHRYNDSTIYSLEYISTSIDPSQSIQPRFRVFSSPFKYGGWGIDGGIPKSFFNSQYLIVNKDEVKSSSLSGNTEVYNQAIATALSQEKSEYMDGLKEVFAVTNRVNHKIIVYQRENLPSQENFVKIVRDLSAKDPNNLWNVPFIYAALQIQPDAVDLTQQLSQMKQMQTQVKYRYGDDGREKEIRSILNEVSEKEKHQHIKYPEVLKN